MPPALVWKPTAEQLALAVWKKVPDILRPGLRLLLVGINPGLYTAAVGHHFARPGNRFWPALHAGGFTPRLYSPFEDATLLELDIGLTNVVARASAAADALTREELLAGGKRLRAKVRRFQPDWVAFLGIGAFRGAFGDARAGIGPQPQLLEGARVWVLPNPSGLNAHYTPGRLGELFLDLRTAISRSNAKDDTP